MKRKTSDKPSRIWSFGAKEPTIGLDLLRDQLAKAHDYWNTLVRIELDRRAAMAEAEKTLSDDDLQRIQEIKNNFRKRMKGLSEEQKKALREEREALLMMVPGYARSVATFAAVNQAAAAEQRKQRGKFTSEGLYWGTYVLVEKAAQDAKTKADAPTFRRWRDHAALMRGSLRQMPEGRLGAHIMKGATPDALVNNTMLQVEWPDLPRDDRQWVAPRGVRRAKGLVKARIRAGSNGRKPIWVEFPVTIHRPLPRDARVKAAWLRCVHVGTKWHYYFELQIESATFRATGETLEGSLAIDLCWRRRPDGIRVAYACDDHGAHREILMPEDVLHDLAKADEIRGHADKVFNEWRDRLADDMGELKLPDEIAKRFAALRQRKSPQRVAMAMVYWFKNRFDGDTQAFDTAWTFMQRWRHLYQLSTGIRVRALGRRKKYYEDIALQLCSRYRTLVVGDFDMRPTVELDQKAGDAPKGARANRFKASPSQFRNIIKSMAGKLGGYVTIVDCKKATLACSACGQEHDLDPFVVDFRCQGCQQPWDRGHNHCINLLKRASTPVPQGPGRPLAPLFPRVLATSHGRNAGVVATKTQRSQTDKKNRDFTGKSAQAVEIPAQEVRS